MLKRLKLLVPRKIKRVAKRTIINMWESVIYRMVRSVPPTGGICHIVFVCKGNICRSAFGEHFLRKVVTEPSVRIESCGLDVDQGHISPVAAVRVAGDFGVDLSRHLSKGLAACDLENADLILPMEYWQYRRLRDIFPELRSKTFLLRDFAPWPMRLLCNIYDPYGLEDKEFQDCFSQMRCAIDGLQRYMLLSRNQ